MFVYDDDVDIEDLMIEYLKYKEPKESKNEPLLENLQRKKDQYEDFPKT